MPGRQFSSASQYRYGFNGKENDPESGTQDYGMRIYNPNLGKFLSVDPLSGKFPMLTPYQFASNTPIQAIDQDGKEAWVVIWASMSIEKSGDPNGRIGHAGIVVKNYVEVIKTINTKVFDYMTGNMKTITSQVKTYEADGSYTYYDLWPVRADMTDPQANVAPIYQQQKFVMKTNGTLIKDEAALETFIKNNDVSALTYKLDPNNPNAVGGEGYNPDGVLKIALTGELSFKLNKQLEAQKNLNADYNAKDNNCSSNVANALNSIGVYVGKELVTTYIIGMMKKINPNQMFNTPNQTYKDLKNNPATTVIKDGGDKMSQDYEDAVLDDAIEGQIK